MTGIHCALLIVPFLLAVATADLTRRRIPNGLLLILVAALATAVVTGVSDGCLAMDSWVHALAGAGMALALTLPGWLLGKLGAGDVKFATLLGASFGVNAFLLSVILAVPWGILFLLLGPARDRNDPMPLPVGALLAGGATVVVFLP